MVYVITHSDAFNVATHFAYDKISNFNMGYSTIVSAYDNNGFRLFLSQNLLSK